MGKDKEIINSNVKKDTILAIIVKRYKISNRIDVTSVNEILQASVLSLKKNNVVQAHKHNLLRRETYGTQEVWIVKKGRGLVSFYDLNDKFLCSKRITKGDIVLNLRGGHGLRPLSRKMVFIEIKNGPYKGSEIDKVSINS